MNDFLPLGRILLHVDRISGKHDDFRWVGDWTYESEAQATPLGPAGTSQWIELDRYDALIKTYSWNGFGSDGSVESANYSFDGATVKYSGTVTLGDKQYKLRGTAVFSADFSSWNEKRELSADGKTWIPRFQSKVTKTSQH